MNGKFEISQDGGKTWEPVKELSGIVTYIGQNDKGEAQFRFPDGKIILADYEDWLVPGMEYEYKIGSKE